MAVAIEWEAFGPIWQPGISAAVSGSITERDAERILSDGVATPLAEWTAEDVEHWILTHTGDLSGVTDWAAERVTTSHAVADAGSTRVVTRTQLIETLRGAELDHWED